jgi:hypothetical protein
MKVILSPFVFRDSQTQGDHFPWYPNLNKQGVTLIYTSSVTLVGPTSLPGYFIFYYYFLVETTSLLGSSILLYYFPMRPTSLMWSSMWRITSQSCNTSTKTRCTIMFDGWTDGRSRTILNFLIACPKGTMFLKSMDASHQVKDAQLLFHLLDEIVLEVGCCTSDHRQCLQLCCNGKDVGGKTPHDLVDSMCSPMFGPHA